MFLHTLQAFKATQKGQVSVDANTEVMLRSDTHWYWWFVAVPSNGEEGFVPAELLELPSERQARVNSRINSRVASVPHITTPYTGITKVKKRVRFSDIGTDPVAPAPSVTNTAGILENVSLVDDDDSDSSDESIDILSSRDSVASPVDPICSGPLKDSLEHLHIEHANDDVHNQIIVQPLLA